MDRIADAGTNYLYVTPLQNQGLVLALLLWAQVCLYGFCDSIWCRPGSLGCAIDCAETLDRANGRAESLD